MKNIGLIFLILFSYTLTFSQAPSYINYQGVLRDSYGNVIANKAISGQIVISGGSNYTYSIPNGTNTNSYGLFKLKVGPISGVN